MPITATHVVEQQARVGLRAAPRVQRLANGIRAVGDELDAARRVVVREHRLHGRCGGCLLIVLLVDWSAVDCRG